MIFKIVYLPFPAALNAHYSCSKNLNDQPISPSASGNQAATFDLHPLPTSGTSGRRF
jgi:hypothetical protein